MNSPSSTQRLEYDAHLRCSEAEALRRMIELFD
jgi:hypothetical protein